MSDEIALTLRQRAIAAVRVEEEENRIRSAKRDAEHIEYLIRALSNSLKNHLGTNVQPSWNPTSGRVEAVVDGLMFILPERTSYPHYASVLLPCPRCSTPLPQMVTELTQLGRMLDAPPSDHWDCPANPPQKPAPESASAPEPTTAERLVSAFEEFIAERFPMGHQG